MSLTEFSIHLGLYDADFTHTIAYDALLTARPVGEPLSDAWRWLSSAPIYDPRRTKAIAFSSPALCSLHFLLSHTLTSHGDSTGVVNLHDLDFLLSMVDDFHLHLGYEVVVSISH